VGLHTGEPSLIAEDYVGLDVHRAARIMNAGHGGQILLSQTTRDLVEYDLPDAVSLRDLGAHRLKDLEQPSHLYQLVTPGFPAEFPPLKTLDTYTHNLPVQPTPLIGREQQVAVAKHLLQRQDVRLLTLIGPGGTGKTRLGLQVAAELCEHYPTGVFFVDLSPISDPALVVPAIAQVLGVKEADGQPLLDLLSASLQEQEVLLLLDNFEQVIGAASEVATLLARCPELKVLVTSRAALHVRWEQEFVVPPLALPDPKGLPDLVQLSQYEAVALFIARAQAVKLDFQVTNTNAPAVAEICVRLDGLPLAIELAAARSKILPPSALLSRLEHRLPVLVGGGQDAPLRQRTLHNTIAWSYDLLEAGEQRLFRRLCLFVGGAALSAIEAVSAALGDEPGSVLDGITSLLDKSLLRQSEPEGEQPRFVMLEMIREYGWEALKALGEAETAQKAHANYYLALAEEAEPQLRGPEQASFMVQLAMEQENLRAALSYLLEPAQVQTGAQERKSRALRLCVALSSFWYDHGYGREGLSFLMQALADRAGEGTALRARALDEAANLAFGYALHMPLEQLAEESLALYQALGDPVGTARSLHRLGIIARARSQFVLAQARLEEAAVRFRDLGDRWREGQCFTELARVATEQGRYEQARTLLDRSLLLYQDLGDQQRIGWVRFLLAWLLFVSDQDQLSAEQFAEQSLAHFREQDNILYSAAPLSLLGLIHLGRGELGAARAVLEDSLAIDKQFGTEAEDIHLAIGRLLALQGDVAAARREYQESLSLLFKWNVAQENVAASLEGLAALETGQGAPHLAARLWGAAAALREAIGAPIYPVYRASYEQAVAQVSAALGEQAFRAFWTEGRSMTPEQVLGAREAVMITPGVSSVPRLPAAPPSPSYPAGLTPREVEVLRLLALGLSDAQIAEQLVISPRTVNRHTTSLYSKLNVSSRNAATRYALEHNLL
jgi:predicted ATPase/DNA-binding CsgD family transcriptional regulator